MLGPASAIPGSATLSIHPVGSVANISNICPPKNDPSLMVKPGVVVTLSSGINSDINSDEQFEGPADYTDYINTFLVASGIAIGVLTAKAAMKYASQSLKLAPVQAEREAARIRVAAYEAQVHQEILREHPHLAQDPGDGSTLTDRINQQIRFNRMDATSPY